MFPYLFPPASPSLPPSLSHPSRWSQSTELISPANFLKIHVQTPPLYCPHLPPQTNEINVSRSAASPVCIFF